MTPVRVVYTNVPTSTIVRTVEVNGRIEVQINYERIDREGYRRFERPG